MGTWLCPECRAKIPLVDGKVCARCGVPCPPGQPCRQCQVDPLHYIDGIRSAAFFKNNPLRPAVHCLKYRGHKAVASILAEFLADTYHRHQLQAQVIVPVPLHASRYRERGYNQSDLLATALGRSLGLPVNRTSLVRIRPTRSQMELTAVERRKNVAKAFDCIDTQLSGQTVLVIDDVCTTGSTLDACAEALKQAGARQVWGLTLARAD